MLVKLGRENKSNNRMCNTNKLRFREYSYHFQYHGNLQEK